MYIQYIFIYVQEYEDKRRQCIILKNKKEEVQADIKKAKELNKPLQNKMDQAKRNLDNIDKEIKKKV